MGEVEFDEELDEDDLADEEDLAPEPTGFFSRRRTLILSSVIGLVFVVAAALFGMRMMGGNDQNASLASQLKKISPDGTVTAPVSVQRKKKKKGKIKYEKLFDVPTTALSDVLRELSFANITFKTEPRGANAVALMIDEDEIDEARNMLAVKGLPASEARGYALLDNAQTLGVTEFDKRIRFIRALSGELEKAIMQLHAIENAKVQIVLPEQRLFAVTQPPVTASILIRRVPGAEVTDDIVFGIVKLVSNAVENLQVENVSVIDAQGMVLTKGLFERIAARDAGLIEEVAPTADLGFGQAEPIIPDFADIQQWFEIKSKFEEELVRKAKKQLVGVLPAGSFKLAVSAELGPLSDGEIVDIKRLTISVVVDNSRDDIFIDPQLKRQVFDTIAGATGYVRGRDAILLNKADFTLLTDAEKEALEKEKDRADLFGRMRLYGLYGAGAVVGIAVLAFVLRRFRSGRAAADAVDSSDDRDADFTDLQSEMNEERQSEQIRQIAMQDPQLVATIMEDWLQQEEVPV